MAAGAELSMIGRVDVVTIGDDAWTLSLPIDNDALEKAITEYEAAWVILDPLLSMISDAIDSHRERDVRKALDPLIGIADRTGAVFLGIAHWNKGSGSDITSRITGSGAFKNVPRSVFGFIRDPDSETGECVMQEPKNSLGRSDLPSLRYQIQSVDIETPSGVANTGRFVLCGQSERSVRDILEAKRTAADSDDIDEEGYSPEQRFIINYLLNEIGGPAYEAKSAQVIDAGRTAGYTEKALVKARNRIKTQINTRRVGFGQKGEWYWQLNPEGNHAHAHQRVNEPHEDNNTEEGVA
jgi:hypothetical protein